MAVLIQSLHYSPAIQSFQNPKPYRRNSVSSSSHLPLLLRFRTSRRQKSQYLKSLGIECSTAATVERLDHILLIVDYLKNKGILDSDFPRLSHLCPQIFLPSRSITTANLDALFAFLESDVNASPEQSRFLITTCPELLRRNVNLSLRPTVEFLKEMSVRNLNSPTTINAHLINTPMERLVDKIRFMEQLGLSLEESRLFCRRFPAIFGYSLEFNLKPKVEYLVGEMKRPLSEMVKFPQYLGFSLEKRIVPRYLHLISRKKERVSLPKMLMYSDAKFYQIWKWSDEFRSSSLRLSVHKLHRNELEFTIHTTEMGSS